VSAIIFGFKQQKWQMGEIKPIQIEEQGLRDGLQTLSIHFPLERRLNWIQRLVAAGVQRLQVGSFVHPRLVPSMADTDQLFQQLLPQPGVIYSALVLNQKGVERAIAAGVQHLSISLSASDTHSLKNAGKNIAQSKQEIAAMISLAQAQGIAVRGGIQCAFGCRYEGAIAESVVLHLSEYLLSLGVDELALADSTGMGNPQQVTRLLREILPLAGEHQVGLHLHNTENKGYANVYAGLEAGVRLFDTAFGGLGGCPFIQGATGNIATEDTVHLLRQMGIETGIDLLAVAGISQEIEAALAQPLPGLLYSLLNNPKIAFN
jgi:hydroxymethylglutaryl-CoA lyase